MKEKIRSKYILLLFLGMIVLLFGGIFLAAQQEKEGPITAEADSSGEEYWYRNGKDGLPKDKCLICGETVSAANGTSIGYSDVGTCAIYYFHWGPRAAQLCKVPMIVHTEEVIIVNPTCTESGWTGAKCSICGTEDKRQTLPSSGHTYVTVSNTATCTEDGIKTSECNKCGDRQSSTAPAIGHSWDSGMVTRSPTCQRPGVKRYECETCGETKTESLPSVSHDYSIYRSRIEPTCTSSGRTSGYECRWCSASTCSTLPALGHSYGSYTQTQAPTCTEEGTETATCIRCPVQNSRAIEALGHDLEYHDGKPATCTEIGWNDYETCNRAGCGYTTYREITATGHTPGAAATCTTPQTCTTCGTELVAALGHKTISHLGQDPTCTAEGWKPYETCENCDYTTYETIEALGHSFTSYVSDNNATCLEDGTETAKCDRCEVTDTRTDEGSALGHDWTEEWTTDGTSHWHECSRCDEINDKANHSGGTATCIALAKCKICGAEYGDFAEHVYVENADEQYLFSAATCTAKATYYKSCSVCGETGEEIFEYGDPLGHAYGEPEWTWEDYTSATATFTCTRGCGDKQTATAAGSSITSVVTTPAECETEGLRTYTAKVMFGGEEYVTTTTETLEALGHDLEHHEAKPATCTEIGWEAYDTCTRCDYTTYVEIEALGHDWAEDWTTDGTAHWHECSRCDEVNDKASHSGGTATCAALAKCEVCGEGYGEVLEHTEGEAIRENEVSANCTVAGSYDEVVYCSVCGEELSREKKVIDALGHSFVGGYCAICGVSDEEALENEKEDAKTDLDDIAQDAKDEIDNSDLPDDVKDDLKDRVDEIINGAKDEVEGCTDFDDVEQAVEDAKAEIEDAILDAEKDDAKSDLDEIAQDAKDEIDGSDLPDDVKDDLKDKVDEIVNDAKTEIDGETSKEEVDNTIEDTRQEIEDAILNAEKDDAKSDLDEIAQNTKDEIDGSKLLDEEKSELKGKVDEIVNEAKAEIEAAKTPEGIEEVVSTAKEEIIVLTEDLTTVQPDMDALWLWIIVAIVISAALSALAAWKIVKDVRVCGESVGVKTVVKIGITTILIFILIIGIALVMFALI